MSDERRLEMPDGACWTVERRHEMTRIARPGEDPHRRRLLLLFRPARQSSAVPRVVEVPGDFPERADDESLRDAWRRAEDVSGRDVRIP